MSAKFAWSRQMFFFIESWCVRFFLWVACVTRTEFDLRNWINTYYDNFYLRRDYTKQVAAILKEKLVHLDVGARGGVLEIVKKYAAFFEAILCEPEPVEADNIRRNGHRVIGMPLYKHPGKVKFYETHRPSGSSIYRPQGPFMFFYYPDKEYFDSYAVKKTSLIECSTISDELKKLDMPELDFLKIDTQGAELDILEGLGDFRPLVMQVEVEYLPMYHDMANAYQICQYLFELGYIPFALTSHHARTLCPTWGDGFFMPNWTHPKGVELIRAREEKYIALMLMFGQVKILQFVAQEINLKNKVFISELNEYSIF
jgi:FkbM family methyltransferase